MDMSIRHPVRLSVYDQTKKFYPRELSEKNGVLYFTDETGNTVILNDGFATEKKVELVGDVTGSASSKNEWKINASLADMTGLTAGNYGPAANASPEYGTAFKVPSISVDAKGRVSAAKEVTITLPAIKHVSISTTDPSSEAVTISGKTFNAISDISRDSNGHVTGYKSGSYTLPDNSVIFNITLGTTWSGTVAPFTQQVNVANLLESDTPFVTLIQSSLDYTTTVEELAEFEKLYRGITANGKITFYASDKTEKNIQLKLLCIR